MAGRKAPKPPPTNQRKPFPPPSPPAIVHTCELVTARDVNRIVETDRRFMSGRNRRVAVRSKASGLSGFAYPDDPHVWVEGPGIAGWYRLDSIGRDFLVVDEEKGTDGAT